jgi:thymidine phosphorylase
VEVVVRKRDGLELSAEEIARFVGGFHAGEVADYQMTAFCMAVFLRGMSHDETAAMTLAMANSGVVMDWFAAAPPSQSSTSGSSSAGGSGGGVRFVDKHSTGGVGDKVSLVLAPLLATFGLRVPMMSGRGLGHTGGTLDKVSE